MNLEALQTLALQGEQEMAAQFAQIDRIAYQNTQKVLQAFKDERVSDAMFAASSGYGYDDKGRETLDRIYARVFGAESAFVRHQIVNGTQALAIALYGLLRPGDVLLAATGKPYDTLDEVIGITGKSGNGSLADFGVTYRECNLLDGTSEEEFARLLADPNVKVVFLQRSKGYQTRKTLSVAELNRMIDFAHAHSNAFVVVDNCYGEFTEIEEPRADLFVGSLIKNPGGGMAETGAYLAGSARAVELASYRFTCPGIGLECGATLGLNKSMYKGFFYAPHTVAQALKTAHLAAYLLEKLGYEVEPRYSDVRHDIIQMVKFGTPEGLCAFCRGIQYASPVDSYVTPEPWAMPGYTDEVIMAAGAFTQGSSIELSADGPLRPPYAAYFQGGLTYESGKYAILSACAELSAGALS